MSPLQLWGFQWSHGGLVQYCQGRCLGGSLASYRLRGPAGWVGPGCLFCQRLCLPRASAHLSSRRFVCTQRERESNNAHPQPPELARCNLRGCSGGRWGHVHGHGRTVCLYTYMLPGSRAVLRCYVPKFPTPFLCAVLSTTPFPFTSPGCAVLSTTQEKRERKRWKGHEDKRRRVGSGHNVTWS